MAGVPLPLIRRWLEGELARRLVDPNSASHSPPVRVIRWAGERGLVAIDVADLPKARARWNAEIVTPDRGTVRLATRRTWGTLRKGKAWLDRGLAVADPVAPPSGRRRPAGRI